MTIQDDPMPLCRACGKPLMRRRAGEAPHFHKACRKARARFCEAVALGTLDRYRPLADRRADAAPKIAAAKQMAAAGTGERAIAAALGVKRSTVNAWVRGRHPDSRRGRPRTP